MARPGPAVGGLGAWLVVGLSFVTLALSFSSRATTGLAMPEWQRDLGWDRGFISAVSAVSLLVMAVVAPFAGHLVDRRGSGRVLAGGIAAVGLGMLLLSQMQSRWLFLLGLGGVAALGFGTIATHVVATAIAGRFESNRGVATGIGLAGATAGQFVIVPLLALVMQAAGWRWSLAVAAGACLAVAPIALIALGAGAGNRAGQRQAGEETTREPPPDAAKGESLGRRLRLLFCSPAFQILFWSFAICGFTTSGAVETHLLPYAASCGFAPLPSATAYGVLSGFNLAGMVTAGWLADRVNRPALLSAIYLVRALCFVLLLFVPGDLQLLYLFAAVFGLFDYSTVPVTASLVASRLGLKTMGLAMGLISAGHSLGAAVGAFLGGWLFDRLGHYDSLWLVSTVAAAFAGLLVLAIRDGRDAAAVPSIGGAAAV
jgi:MFS family permease